MTTQENLAFRAAHLRDSAARLEAKARELNDLAASYRAQAEACDARRPQEIGPQETDRIERIEAGTRGAMEIIDDAPEGAIVRVDFRTAEKPE
jgi:hypothetical protein